MTVAELGRRMSGREMAEWEVYARVEPFGIVLANLLAAHLCTVIHTPYNAKSNIGDFLLTFGKTEATGRVTGPDQVQSCFKAMAEGHKRNK